MIVLNTEQLSQINATVAYLKINYAESVQIPAKVLEKFAKATGFDITIKHDSKNRFAVFSADPSIASGPIAVEIGEVVELTPDEPKRHA